MTSPKHLHDLSILPTLDPKTLDDGTKKESWASMVSKDTAGPMATLMSVNDESENNKMNATLLDILDQVERKTPKKADEIQEYRNMVLRRGLDTPSEEVKNNRNKDDDGYWTQLVSQRSHNQTEQITK